MILLRKFKYILFILFLLPAAVGLASPSGIGFEVVIIKPDDTPLEASSVDFKIKITDPLGTCVIYVEELLAQDLSGSQGQKSFTIGTPALQTYPDPMMTPLTMSEVFSNSNRVFACQAGGSYTSAAIDKRQLVLEFNDGSGAQALAAMDINSVPFALEAASITGMPTCAANQSISFNGSGFTCVASVSSVTSGNSYLSVATTTSTPVLTLNVGTIANTVAAGNDSRFTDTRTPTDNSVTSIKIVDGAITSSDISAAAIQDGHLSQMGAGIGQVMKWDGGAWVASADNSGGGSLVTSVAGRTGVVTLSSGDITGLSFGTTTGTFAEGNDSRFTDTRTPTDNSVTSAKIADGTIISADISAAAITFDKLNQSSAVSGQVIKWNGSAWVASSDETGAGGIITSVSAGGPLSSSGGSTPTISITQASGATDGYLSSADWTTFNSKLSNFSTLTSADITSKYGYTPLANFTTMTSGDVTTALGYIPANVGSVILASQMPGNCSAGQTLTFSSPTGSWVCSSIVLGSNSVLSSMVSSLDWSKVANTPTTAAAYGIPKATVAVDGYLSSADFTVFYSKLSDFSTLSSSDITGKLGYTPVNPAGAVTSVAGRTGVVTLSSGDITGFSFGTTVGTYAQGNDARFTDERTPSNDSVTSAKILDGTITSADLSNASVTAAKLESAANGELFIGNGSGFAKATLTGTANQLTVTSGAGSIALSIPQNIHSAATPTFSGLTLSGITGNTLLRANGSGVLANATSADVTTLLGYTPPNPSGSLKMTGQIASGSQVITGGTTSIDWNSGNIISTDYDCSSNLTFANLVDGGTYTLIVTSTGTTQCDFSTTTTGVGAGTVSYRYKPANAARTSSSHSIYTLMRSGSNVYISWTSGF